MRLLNYNIYCKQERRGVWPFLKELLQFKGIPCNYHSICFNIIIIVCGRKNALPLNNKSQFTNFASSTSETSLLLLFSQFTKKKYQLIHQEKEIVRKFQRKVPLRNVIMSLSGWACHTKNAPKKTMHFSQVSQKQ